MGQAKSGVNTSSMRIYLLAVIGLLLLISLGQSFRDRGNNYNENDFAHYYVTAALTIYGIDPYAEKLVPAYGRYGLNPSSKIVQATNPPALAALTSPLGLLSPSSAYKIWSLTQLLSLLIGVYLLIRTFLPSLSLFDKTTLIFAALAPYGVYAHFKYGQTQCLIFFLYVLGLCIARSREAVRVAVGTFLWGIATSLKIFTFPIFLPVIFFFGLRGVLWFILGFSSLNILFLALVGESSILSYSHSALPYISEVATKFSGNLALVPALKYSLQHVASFQLSTILGSTLQLFGYLTLLGVILFYGRRNLEISVSLAITGSILFSPTAWAHYLPLTFIGLSILLARASFVPNKLLWLGLTTVVYFILGTGVGLISSSHSVLTFISIWWGPVGYVALMALLCWSSLDESKRSKNRV